MLSRRLLRHIPESPLRLRTPFDLFHDPIFSDFNGTPQIDLKELNDSFLIKADVPGFQKDQIDIDVSGNTLTLKGTMARESDETEGNWAIKEREESSFQRSIGLPVAIKMDAIKASLKDGVLSLEVPKDRPATNKVMIE